MWRVLVCVLAMAPVCAVARSAARCADPGVDGQASRAFGPSSAARTFSCAPRSRRGRPTPDPLCTPGAVNPTVTATSLIDRSFRTGCVRDRATTHAEKASTYESYGVTHPARNSGATQTCELDHLVPLELGGADTLDNIWPECGAGGGRPEDRYFKQKDRVENYLAEAVRDGRITLSSAQRGIAADWTQYLAEALRWAEAP